MVKNPYKAPAESPQSAPRFGRNIGCGMILFLTAIPMLVIGFIWAMGGSRPHHASIVTPMGIVTLAIAVAMMGLASHFFLNAYYESQGPKK